MTSPDSSHTTPATPAMPKRGTVLVDMSAFLLLAGRKKASMSSDEHTSGQMYLDTLYRMADAGFEVVIPEIVLFKAANIYQGREIYTLFDNNEYTNMRTAVSKWLRDMPAHPNVKVVSTGPGYVQKFLNEVGKVYDRANTSIQGSTSMRRAGASDKLMHVSHRRSFSEVARSGAVHDIAGLQRSVADLPTIDHAIISYIESQPANQRHRIIFLSDNKDLSEDTEAYGASFLKVRRMLHLFERQGLLAHMGFAPGKDAEQHFEAMVQANCDMLPEQKTFDRLTNLNEYTRALPQIPASDLFDGLAPALDAAKQTAVISHLPVPPDGEGPDRMAQFRERYGAAGQSAARRKASRLSSAGGDTAGGGFGGRG